MADTMHTWFSKNAPVEQQWLGYVYLDGNRLPIAFFASTEDEVKAKMRELYAKDKEVRDANRARRAEQKTARSSKKEAEPVNS